MMNGESPLLRLRGALCAKCLDALEALLEDEDEISMPGVDFRAAKTWNDAVRACIAAVGSIPLE